MSENKRNINKLRKISLKNERIVIDSYIPYNNKDFQTLIKTKGHDSINDKGDVILNPLHISTYLWTTKERFAQEHLENIKNLYLKIKTNNIEITPFITHFHQIIECFKYIENEILKFRYLENQTQSVNLCNEP